jgi:hypothetical protein
MNMRSGTGRSGHAAEDMGDIRATSRILAGKSEIRQSHGISKKCRFLRADRRTILKCFLKQRVRVRLDSCNTERALVNTLMNTLGGKFLDHLRNYQFVHKPAPWA